jgi:hypothetical protein
MLATTLLYRLTGKRVFLMWASSLLIVGLVVVWIVLLYIGWLAIFSGHELAVVRGQDQSPASFGERVYFTGFTISTLGVGDYVPRGAFWQFVTTLSAISGFTLVTFIISFLLSVASQQTLRRKLALHIHYIGATPQAIVRDSWDAERGKLSGGVIESVFSDLVQFQGQQLDQPIFNRFHGPSRMRSIELSLAILDEALTIALCVLRTDPPPEFWQARRLMTDYIDTLDDPDADSSPPLPDLTGLYESGIPVADEGEVQAAYADVEDRRRKLYMLVTSTGWAWDDVEVFTQSIQYLHRG